MKILKACITMAFWATGMCFTVNGYKNYYSGDTEAANSNFKKSYFFHVPAIILGCAGWNVKNALAK